MIFHPHIEGVTIHRPEDVDITYKGKPVVTGYCKRTGHKFWRASIEAPQDNTPKLLLVDQLLLSKLPPVLREQLSEASEIAHNVYEIPSLAQGIK